MLGHVQRKVISSCAKKLQFPKKYSTPGSVAAHQNQTKQSEETVSTRTGYGTKKIRSKILMRSILSFRMTNDNQYDKKHFILPLDQPVVAFEAAQAFTALSVQQRLYAYHLSQACWTGSLIALVQTSPEAPALFVLLHKLFSAISPSKLRAAAQAAFIPDDDVTTFFVYAVGVFSNSGNFKVSTFDSKK